MKIDKGEISGTRFMFTIAFFLQASALLTSFLAGVVKQDSWIVVIFGAVVCMPLVWLYRTLMVTFPDKNYMQILEFIYGPVVGKVIGIAYIWFFLTVTSLNLTDLGNFTKIVVMTQTPHTVLTVMCMLVTAWAVRYGIDVVTRYARPFTFVEFFIVAFSILLAVNQIKLENFLPMFDFPAMKYIQGTHIITTIPFGELVTFLMITPNVKLTRRQASRCWYAGVGIGISTLLVVLMRDIAMLGTTLQLFTLPGLVTLRLVRWGEAFSRMEILFAIAVVMLLFFKITFLTYITVIAIAQAMNVREYRHLVLVTGALIITFGLTLYANPVEHTTSAREVEPIIWSLFEVIIPLLTYIVAKLRKLPKVSEKPGEITGKQEV